MGMWVATRNIDTPSGTVAAGRLVADGDPILDGAPDGAFVPVQDDGQVLEEAVADKPRRSIRRKA